MQNDPPGMQDEIDLFVTVPRRLGKREFDFPLASPLPTI